MAEVREKKENEKIRRKREEWDEEVRVKAEIE